jgi:hypothetical protein
MRQMYDIDIRLLRTWAEEFTYKPNVQIRITSYDAVAGRASLLLVFHVEDTYRPGTWGDVGHSYVIPWLMTPDRDEFAAWLRSCVHKAECHEADECLKRNGEMIFDPHAPPTRIGRLPVPPRGP